MSAVNDTIHSRKSCECFTNNWGGFKRFGRSSGTDCYAAVEVRTRLKILPSLWIITPKNPESRLHVTLPVCTEWKWWAYILCRNPYILWVHMRIHTYIHEYIHIHICTYIHTYRQAYIRIPMHVHAEIYGLITGREFEAVWLLSTWGYSITIIHVCPTKDWHMPTHTCQCTYMRDLCTPTTVEAGVSFGFMARARDLRTLI